MGVGVWSYASGVWVWSYASGCRSGCRGVGLHKRASLRTHLFLTMEQRTALEVTRAL